MRPREYEQRPLTASEQQFFQDNIRLVYAFMRSGPRIRSAEDREDFAQELMIGLSIAVLSYRPEKASFSTHAWWKFRQVQSEWMKKQKRRGEMFVSMDADEDFKIEPSYDAEKTPVEEFREYCSTNLSRRQREGMKELTSQRVNYRWLTKRQRQERRDLRLKVMAKIRQNFKPGEVENGEERTRQGHPSDDGRDLRNGTQLEFFGPDSHDPE
jgi:RNA polymerase sigma factor (sigma-70 family)